MAYVNVAEWKPDQVTEWLKGLDSTVLQYIHSFLRNEVNGQQLLNLRPDDLNHLGVQKLGHQELILEAVEHLRNFHYELDRENLQLLALRLACRARSLYNELKQRSDLQPLSTQTLADVAHVIMAVKPLVCWLDRSPFSGQFNYQERKDDLLHLSLQIATCAQRDRFAEKPVEEIRSSCEKLANLGDEIIQDIADPLVLQPASLDLVTLKKKASDDLGFFILPSFHGVHQIAEINFSSPAHQCGKIENGDEIVQVNYQTVVGWQTKKVMALFEESPTEVFLTLKKCPRHTKVYGQIYMKPYRLPSKKRSAPYSRWNDNLPSPRPELLTIPDFEIPLPKVIPKKVILQSHSQFDCKSTLTTEEKKEENMEDTFERKCEEDDDDDDDDDDDSFLPEAADEGQPSPMSMRLYLPKPRVTVQRRATVTGASPTSKRPPVNLEQFWAELRLERHWRDIGVTETADKGKSDLFHLRDKSASVGNGLAFNFSRPYTTLGIETVVSKLKCSQQLEALLSNKKSQKNIGSVQITATEAHIISDQWAVDSREENSHFNSEVNTSGHVCLSEKNVLSGRDEILCDVANSTQMLDSHDNCFCLTSPERFEDQVYDGTETFKIIGQDFSVINFPVIDEISSQVKCNSEVIMKENFLESNGPLDRKTESRSDAFQRNFLAEPSESVHGAIDDHFCYQATQNGKERGRLDKSYSTPAYDLLDSITFLEKRNNVCEDSVSENLVNVEVEIETAKVNHCTVQTPVNQSSFPSVSNMPNTQASLFSDGFGECKNQECGNEMTTVSELDSSTTELLEQSNSLSFSDDMSNSCTCSNLECSVLKNQVACSNASNTPIISVGEELSEHLFFGQFHTDICLEKKATGMLTDSHCNFRVSMCSEKSHHTKLSETPCIFLADVETDQTLSSCNSVSEVSSQTSNILERRLNSLDQTCKVKKNSQLSTKCDASKWPMKIITNHNTTGSIMGTKSGFINATKSFPAAFFMSPRSTRKRNVLLSKRRKVSVKDVGCGDCEGWLLHRFRSSGAGATWLKLWFILKGIICYGFRSPQATKAHIMIVLPGFTVCVAEEVKSRCFAFKIYHTGTVFYLAAETAEELNVWLECLSAAALSQKLVKTPTDCSSQNIYFSETDEDSDSQKDSDSETSIPNSGCCKFDRSIENNSQQLWKVHQNSLTDSKKTDNPKLFGSLKKIVSKNESICSTMQTDLPELASSSLDRKYLHFFGGIRNNNVPVPTAQFRSYRRAPKTFPVMESKLDGRKSDYMPVDVCPSSRNDNLLKNSNHSLSDLRDCCSTSIVRETKLTNDNPIALVKNKGSLMKTEQCNNMPQDIRFSSSDKLASNTLVHDNALALQKMDSRLETNVTTNPNRKCFNLKAKTQHQSSSISQVLGSGRKVHPKEEGPKIKLAFEMQLGESKLSTSPNKDTFSKPSKLRNLFLFTRNQNIRYSHDEASSSSGEPCKPILGSPRLNRTFLWEKQVRFSKNSSRKCNNVNPLTFTSPSVIPPRRTACSSCPESDCSISHSKPMMGVAMISKKPCKEIMTTSSSSFSQSCSAPDYPGLEYPPVFEPETYTLSDASTLLKSRHYDSCTNSKVCACSPLSSKQTNT